MSLQDDAGRFTRRHEDSDFNSCGSSVTTVAGGIAAPPLHASVFDERLVPPTHYEPGSGAEFMVRSGYHLHDQYGRPIHDGNNGGSAGGIGGKRDAPLHRITFSHSPDYKRLYLSALIVVTLMLITLIVVILILFATKVFVVNTVMPLHAGRYSPAPKANGGGASPAEVPPSSSYPDEWTPRGAPPRPEPAVPAAVVEPAEVPQPPATQSPPTHLEGSGDGVAKRPVEELEAQPPPVRWRGSSHEETPALVTRSFECELYILLQRNAAYDDINSFEYRQATTNIQDALSSLASSPTFHNRKPVINLVQIENSANDLRVVFRLSTKSAPGYGGADSIDDTKVREALLRDLPHFEAMLNGVEIDRARVAVQIVGEL